MFDEKPKDLIPTFDEPPPQVQEIKMEITDIDADGDEDNGGKEEVKESILPVVEEKIKLQQDEVFVNNNRPKTPTRSRSPEQIITGGSTSPVVEKPKLTKSGRKKRVLSEKQKTHLAEARKKAMIVRKANKVIRDKEKADKKSVSIQRKEEREELQVVREEKKLKAEIESGRIQEEVIEAEQRNLQRQQNLISVPPTMDRQLIEDLMFNGIARYDEVRKKRKIEKRAKQAVAAREQQMTNTIRRAANLPPNNNPYQNCFSFS